MQFLRGTPWQWNFFFLIAKFASLPQVLGGDAKFSPGSWPAPLLFHLCLWIWQRTWNISLTHLTQPPPHATFISRNLYFTQPTLHATFTSRNLHLTQPSPHATSPPHLACRTLFSFSDNSIARFSSGSWKAAVEQLRNGAVKHLNSWSVEQCTWLGRADSASFVLSSVLL